MKTIDNWIILELSSFVLNGVIEHRNIYTDELILIKDGYAVTTRNIYKLGKPDKVWIGTKQADEYVKRFL